MEGKLRKSRKAVPSFPPHENDQRESAEITESDLLPTVVMK